MKNAGFTLFTLSFAFLCTDNGAGQLFAKSNNAAISENYLDAYFSEADDLEDEELSEQTLKQKKTELSVQNDDDSLNLNRDSQLNGNSQTNKDFQINRDSQVNGNGQTDKDRKETPNCPPRERQRKCASRCDCDAICCPEIIEDCCECNICPPICPITPKAGPCVDCGLNIYGTADFIYWTAREQGTAFGAISGFRTFGSAAPISSPTGKVINPKNKWNPGFKVGLGIDFCHDGWDLYANYTWFRTHSSRTTSAFGVHTLPGSGLAEGTEGTTLYDSYWAIATGFPSFFGGTLGNVNEAGTPLTVQPVIFQTVNGSWKLNFNVIDLELGRHFYISPRLTLRPHFGLKGTWQKQRLNVTFSDPVSSIGLFLVDPTDFRNMKNKFTNWGIGPRAGLNTAWHFTRLFSLLGDVAVTGLWEHFSVNRSDVNHVIFPPFVTPPSNATSVHLKNHFYTFAPVIEWMLGFRYEWWSVHTDYHFALDIGWESQHWLFQNQFIRAYYAESNNGTLGLHGLTLQARFDF